MIAMTVYNPWTFVWSVVLSFEQSFSNDKNCMRLMDFNLSDILRRFSILHHSHKMIYIE